MTPFIRELVRRRAGEHCEYCRVAQSSTILTFHVEHIIAAQHGGGDEPENLALACERCNHFKGPNLSSIDPNTGNVVRLFNPRQQSWDEHFRQIQFVIAGLTDVGRATVRLFNMNTEDRIKLRQWEEIDRNSPSV